MKKEDRSITVKNLAHFISLLKERDELIEINENISTTEEMTEFIDRLSRGSADGGKAVLFTNTGTQFPLIANMFGSEKRMALALSCSNINDLEPKIDSFFQLLKNKDKSFTSLISKGLKLLKLKLCMPKYSSSKGLCHRYEIQPVDLNALPILKCWPFDGGRFITLPMVHTVSPITKEMNVGMYRMQVLDHNTTCLHWHEHKTGNKHYQEYKQLGLRMPVTVTLGGSPCLTYSATAPLPDGVNEYILAGVLSNTSVKLVKSLTNDIYIPSESDIVLEGYVDPLEEKFFEGPFGDHTGYYSLEDYYPKFHIEKITYRDGAVYPATIVGIPPQEDKFIADATERIFLAPIKQTLQPEVVDMHLPSCGVAHNFALVSIYKTYSGQGLKVANALMSSGQMMFNKFMFVFSSTIDIRSPLDLVSAFHNFSPSRDIFFTEGPSDVLDHSSSIFAYTGKMVIDLTKKTEDELARSLPASQLMNGAYDINLTNITDDTTVICDTENLFDGYNAPIELSFVSGASNIDTVVSCVSKSVNERTKGVKIVIILNEKAKVLNSVYYYLWLVASNTEPIRDTRISNNILYIDARAKLSKLNGFSRHWPNVVTSSDEIISLVDSKFERVTGLPFVESPSLRFIELLHKKGAYAE